MLRVLSLILFIFLSNPLVAGGKIPAYYKDYKEAQVFGEKLDYVVLSVNNDSQVIRSGNEFQLIKGSQFVIKDAVLKDQEIRPRTVNLVGYRGPEDGADDRGFLVDSTKIESSWSVTDGYKEKTYVIIVYSGKVIHGTISVKVIDPQLEYADILVNDEKTVMREGEVLKVKASDRFKVQKVVTNIKYNMGIRFQIRPSIEPMKVGQENHENLDIIFSYKEYIFAKIPIYVEKI